MSSQVADQGQVVPFGIEFQYGRYGYFPLTEHGAELVEAVYTKYHKQLLLPLVQGEYISLRPGPEREGVCEAMALQWCARVLKGKYSFSIGKNGKVIPPVIEKGFSWQKRIARFFKKFAFYQIKYTAKEQRQLLNLKKQKSETVYQSGQTSTEQFLGNLSKMIDQDKQQNTFLLRLQNQDPDGQNHAISISFLKDDNQAVVMVMDPNAGEFVFREEDCAIMIEFFRDLIGAYTHEIHLKSIKAAELTEETPIRVSSNN